MRNDDVLQRGLRRARHPGHRAAVLGVRQLRAPASRCSPSPGTPADPYEKIADAAQVHRLTGLAPTRGAAHPVGPGRRLRRAAPPRRGPRRRARHDQLEHVPGRRLQARQPRAPTTRRVRRKAIDHHLAASTIMDETGSRGPEDLARRRHELPRPGRHARAGRTAWPTSLPEIYARLGDDQRLVLEYKFFEPAFYHTDVPDWGTSYAQVRRARRAGDRLPRHRAPRARHEHRVHRRCSCCGSGSSARSTSTRASTPTTT